MLRSKGNHDQKIAEWKNSNVGVASILAGFYQLAGSIDLADRIRPTVRKTTGAGKETEQEAEPVKENEESPVLGILLKGQVSERRGRCIFMVI
ncbi:MAG: hypothetical protein GX267_15720 [Fibrobacter sp.]|jgi:hypothetical protein|nr:hypothetical protein [Fibrobacter sp.]